MPNKKLETIKGKTESSPPQMGYLSINGNNRDVVLSKYSSEKFDCAVRKPEKALGYEFVTDISVRVPFTQADYEHFRPAEAIPRKFNDIVKACRLAYYKIGVVRNVIDMMTDFAIEDFKIIHPDKKKEIFAKAWARKTHLNVAVEELARHLLIDGNAVIKRVTANLPEPVKKEMNERIKGDPDIKIYTENNNVGKREIPWKYMFLNILAITWQGGDLAKMAGLRNLAFTISPTVMGLIRKPAERQDPKILNQIPIDIKEAVLGNRSNTIPLDMSKLHISHWKKDSWDDWAPPFLVSILGDLYFKDKLRQAEHCALDGLINTIRIWKLGDHKEGILPDDAAIAKLINILNANTGGGVMDLVWDSMITVEEHYPPIDKILGQEKFAQVNRDILIGMGVPEVLIGGHGGNFSNSWIQLKTLIERLKYIRVKIRDWLAPELEMLSNAMDWSTPPIVHFNEENLQDENINKKLILGLMDRGIVSVEAVLNAYGQDFMVELDRIKQQKEMLKDAGVEIKSPIGAKDQKGQPKEGSSQEGGRPSQTQDVERDERTPNPRGSVDTSQLTLFALDAIDSIDQNIIPIYMEDLGVDNARKLTNEQKEQINTIRAIVLACIKFNEDLSKDNLIKKSENININKEVIDSIKASVSQSISKNNGNLTLLQRKRAEALGWVNYYINN